MIAPPWLPIPPRGYGGIELVVYDLTEGLVRRGHEVLLFAPGNSRTSAELVPLAPEHIGQDWPAHARHLGQAFSKYAYARAFLRRAEIIHDHTLYHETALPVSAVHTLHGPTGHGAEIARRMCTDGQHNYFVAISHRQRQLYGEEGINFVGTVHNALDTTTAPFAAQKDGYLLFVGRANWEKGLDLAVRVAVRSKQRLVMAVKMTESHEQEYFRQHVAPHLDGSNITILGEITPQEKFELYKHASGTLFTSQWEEPFGLVMTESMACGTPVLALRRGAAPEVIRHGETGFLCESEDEMVEYAAQVSRLDPFACREHVERNFSVDKMAAEYEQAYRRATAGVVAAPSLN